MQDYRWQPKAQGGSNSPIGHVQIKSDGQQKPALAGSRVSFVHWSVLHHQDDYSWQKERVLYICMS